LAPDRGMTPGSASAHHPPQGRAIICRPA
jgi:hypothetical protein